MTGFFPARTEWARLILCTVVFLLVAAPAWADVTVNDLTADAVKGVGPHMQNIDNAIKRFNTKDYAGALEELGKAKQAVARLAPPEIMMAKLYLDAKDVPGTVGMLERAVARVPEDPEAYVMLGERALAEGRMTEAEMLFAKASSAIEAFAENPSRKVSLQKRTLLGGAAVNQRRAQPQEARTKLEALLKLDADSATAHDALARVLFGQNDLKAAFAEFEHAAKFDPKAPPAGLAMASMFTDKVNVEKWLNFTVKKGGDDLRTRLALANYLRNTNQIEQAREHAEAALNLDPDGADANFMMGFVERMLGEYPAAEKHLSKAHLMSPLNFEINDHLALALIELPDEINRRRALQFAELNGRMAPNNPEAAATFGWVNYRLNNRQEAQNAFNAVIKGTSTGAESGATPDMCYYLAVFNQERGQAAAAIQLLTEALNSEAPFAYRKSARQLLDQLAKSNKAAAAAARKGKVVDEVDKLPEGKEK